MTEIGQGSRWRRWMAGPATALAVAGVMALETACQPGTTGPLEPAQGETRGDKGRFDGNSVRIERRGMRIDVSGMWTTRLDANSVRIAVAYTNRGTTARTIDMSGFAATRSHDAGEITEVVDMTGIDLNDNRTDNDDATVIINVYDKKTRGNIAVLPGQTRIVEAEMPFPEGVTALDDGQAVVVRIPTSSGPGAARFVTA